MNCFILLFSFHTLLETIEFCITAIDTDKDCFTLRKNCTVYKRYHIRAIQKVSYTRD